jgi:signal transduction histidine kinase
MADEATPLPRPIDNPLPALGRTRGVAPAVIAVVVALSLAQHPGPSLTGVGLAVSLSLAVLVAATTTLVLRVEGTAIALMALIAASACLAWLQPDGAGDAGMFVAVALAGLRLPAAPSIVALALAAAASVPPALHAERSAAMIAGTELGIIAFYLVARFGRSAAEAHEQTRRLLLELQASRHAEAEAAMLRERSRVARDVHDVLAHSLSGLMLQLEGARMLSTQRMQTASSHRRSTAPTTSLARAWRRPGERSRRCATNTCPARTGSSNSRLTSNRTRTSPPPLKSPAPHASSTAKPR